ASPTSNATPEAKSPRSLCAMMAGPSLSKSLTAAAASPILKTEIPLARAVSVSASPACADGWPRSAASSKLIPTLQAPRCARVYYTQLPFFRMLLMNLRLLIADDHAVVRAGLRALLESRKGWEVCAEAADGREAVEKAVKLKPDVVILDIGMP